MDIDRREAMAQAAASLVGCGTVEPPKTLTVGVVRMGNPGLSGKDKVSKWAVKLHGKRELQRAAVNFDCCTVLTSWDGPACGRVLSWSFDGRWLRATVEVTAAAAAELESGRSKLRPAVFNDERDRLRQIDSLALVPAADAFWGDEPE